MKSKIAVTTGSRAEYGILRPVLEEISKNKKLDLYLIVTGTHLSKKHGFTINEIKKDGFKIFAKIGMLPKGNSNYHMAIILGEGVVSFSKLFNKLKPDINLILGDRDEMLASAIAAYHMNIPNAHIHGGDKTQGGIDEYTRHAITKISNIHFAATKKSYNRIIKMGENLSYVFLTGSPSVDEIIANHITRKNHLEKKYKLKLNGNEILLVYHPVTTDAKSSGKQITNILKAITDLKITTIAIAPNSDAGNKEIFENLIYCTKKYPFFNMYKTIPRSDYLGFLKNCGVLVGNSSSGLIEANYFDLPVVNIGIRQKGREHGKMVINVLDGKTKNIYLAIKKSLKRNRSYKKKERIYGTGNSAKKIIKILEKIKLDKKLIQKQINY